jgi:hypothetical protein
MEYFAAVWAKGEKQIPCGDDNKKTRAKTKTKAKAKAKGCAMRGLICLTY